MSEFKKQNNASVVLLNNKYVGPLGKKQRAANKEKVIKTFQVLNNNYPQCPPKKRSENREPQENGNGQGETLSYPLDLSSRNRNIGISSAETGSSILQVQTATTTTTATANDWQTNFYPLTSKLPNFEDSTNISSFNQKTTDMAPYQGNTYVHPCPCTVCGFQTFKCLLCPENFTKGSNFRQHLETHIIRSAPPHVCPICFRGFMSRNYAVRHLRLHMGDSPYKCFICSQLFMDGRLLKSHMASKERAVSQFACSSCGMPYRQKYRLRIHMKTCPGKKISFYGN